MGDANLDPVHKVTILRGAARWATRSCCRSRTATRRPARKFSTSSSMPWRTGRRGARFTSPKGASDDIEKASKLAGDGDRVGMSSKLGAVKYGTGDASRYGPRLRPPRDYPKTSPGIDRRCVTSSRRRTTRRGRSSSSTGRARSDVGSSSPRRDPGQGRPRAHPGTGAQNPAHNTSAASASAPEDRPADRDPAERALDGSTNGAGPGPRPRPLRTPRLRSALFRLHRPLAAPARRCRASRRRQPERQGSGPPDLRIAALLRDRRAVGAVPSTVSSRRVPAAGEPPPPGLSVLSSGNPAARRVRCDPPGTSR